MVYFAFSVHSVLSRTTVVLPLSACRMTLPLYFFKVCSFVFCVIEGLECNCVEYVRSRVTSSTWMGTLVQQDILSSSHLRLNFLLSKLCSAVHAGWLFAHVWFLVSHETFVGFPNFSDDDDLFLIWQLLTNIHMPFSIFQWYNYQLSVRRYAELLPLYFFTYSSDYVYKCSTCVPCGFYLPFLCLWMIN